MTAEQIYQKWTNEYHLEGNNGGIQKHKSYILQMMQEYAKLMCDKQRQICADNALMEQHTGQGKSLVNYVIGQDILHSKDELFISKHSIENSPYPDELT